MTGNSALLKERFLIETESKGKKLDCLNNVFSDTNAEEAMGQLQQRANTAATHSHL